MFYQLNLCCEPLVTPRSWESVLDTDTAIGILLRWEEYSAAFRAGKMFTVTCTEEGVSKTVDIYEFAHQHAEKWESYLRDAESIDRTFAGLV
jgi:hypothetical protein